jgi:hypothetical protein
MKRELFSPVVEPFPRATARQLVLGPARLIGCRMTIQISGLPGILGRGLAPS